ncbi:MAG: alpha/beta hydrolase [Deltaproteobacteria bacterium]|nr:alpha/beta hydrolase [Deltaproteobacteria bacterium]
MLNTKFIELDGIKVRISEYGSGPAVLFIHGFPETLQAWRKNVPSFAERHRAVAFDLVGLGDSDKADYDYSCIGLGRFTLRLMETLEIDKAHLVGADSGALVALAAAALDPARVDKLVIFSGTAYPSGISAFEVRLMMAPLLGDLIFLPFGALGLRAGLRKGFFDVSFLEKPTLDEYVRCLSTVRSRWIALRLMRELGRGADEIMAKLRAKSPPALILWAEHERYFYPWVPERLSQDLKGSKLEYITDSGHFIQEEKADLFNKRVVEFLSS